MRTKFAFLFTVLLPLSALHAQVTSQDTTSLPPTVSRTEIQQDVRKEVERAARDADRKAQQRVTIIQQHTTSAVSTAKKELQDALDQKTEKMAEETRQQTLASEARQRAFMYQITALAGAGALGASLITFVLVRNNRRKAKVIPIAWEERQDLKEKSLSGILKDPTLLELKAFSSRNNGIKKFPIIISLPQQNVHYNCTVELVEGNDPVVWFEGEADSVSWDHRRKKARQLFDSRVQQDTEVATEEATTTKIQ